MTTMHGIESTIQKTSTVSK